jgi:hypothetical protein
MSDSIEKGIFSFILNDLEPLRKEYTLSERGFFVLSEIQKNLNLYESVHGDTEMYIPDTLYV